MTDENDTVPVSAMGIGDDDVKAELEQHAEKLRGQRDVVSVDVKTDILAGVAHVNVQFTPDVTTLPDEVQNYVIAEGLHMFDPRTELEGNALEVRLTTGEIYEVWGGMESPDW